MSSQQLQQPPRLEAHRPTEMASSGSTQCYYLPLGLGIGVPLAVLLLAAIATAIYYRHKYVQTKQFLQQYQQYDNSRLDVTTSAGPEKSLSNVSGAPTQTPSMSQMSIGSQQPRKALTNRTSQNWPFTPEATENTEPRAPRTPHPLIHQQSMHLQRSPIIPISELAVRRSNSQHRNFARPDRGGALGNEIVPDQGVNATPRMPQNPALAEQERCYGLARARRSSDALGSTEKEMRDSYTTW